MLRDQPKLFAKLQIRLNIRLAHISYDLCDTDRASVLFFTAVLQSSPVLRHTWFPSAETEARAAAWAKDELVVTYRSMDGIRQVESFEDVCVSCFSDDGPDFLDLITQWSQRAGVEDTTISMDGLLGGGAG